MRRPDYPSELDTGPVPTASCLERTLLHPGAGIQALDKALAEARAYQPSALCVSPFWVRKARRELGDAPTVLSTVVGFPFGYQRTEAKLLEIELALRDGATDAQVTLNTSAAFSPSSTWIKIELAKCAALLHAAQATFTVILESSLLSDEQVAHYCQVSADAGADFVKNATGFLHNTMLNASLVEQTARLRGLLHSSVGLKIVGKINSLPEVQKLLAAGATHACVDTSLRAIFGPRD